MRFAINFIVTFFSKGKKTNLSLLLFLGLSITSQGEAFNQGDPMTNHPLSGLRFINFNNQADKNFKQILSSSRLRSLIEDVKTIYGTDEIIFQLDSSLDAHGAFDPSSVKPLILLNPQSGFNESNIAHELIHAILFKKGFFSTPKGLFNDKREKVMMELNSNILYIPLVKIMKDRGFDIKEYLDPTLTAIKKALTERKNQKYANSQSVEYIMKLLFLLG